MSKYIRVKYKFGCKTVRINVILPRVMKDELEKLVRSGEFATLSDAVREAIRLLLEKYKNKEK